jgi:two-component system response regulator AtoC
MSSGLPASDLIGASAGMYAVRHIIEQVAQAEATILISGESGVGKEVVARAIHVASGRRGPMVKVNCAALPADLLESELFGHEKGAFTGAFRQKPGKFELAHQGTLLLDEIGELPLALQAKLLHVLQDHEFARVGGSSVIKADARVLAATNRHLESAVHAGQFREDLYYRLNVITIRVPPLRERRDEIPALACAFVERFNAQFGRSVKLGAESLKRLTDYRWPGNVRELENMMRRVVLLDDERLLAQEIAAITPRSGPLVPEPTAATAAAVRRAPTYRSIREAARRAARDAERQALLEVLEQVHWNRAEAARLLKMKYKTLLYMIDRCGLPRDRQTDRH